MINLYLIRHAESIPNLASEQFGGRLTGADITQTGLEQSENLGRRLASSGIMPNVVLTSPAKRARLTGLHALQAAGLSIELIIDDDLEEVSLGQWEGLGRKEIQTEALLKTASKLGNDFKAPGGESVNDVIRRGRHLLTGFERDYASGATIFAFTHGFFTRALVGDLKGWDYQTIRDTPTPNTSITRLQIDPLVNADWQVVSVGQKAWTGQAA